MNNRFVLRAPVLLLAMLFATSAVAEEWDWKVAPYLWAIGISGDGSGGEVPFDLDLETSDILNLLDGAALLWTEASKGPNNWYADLAFLAIEPEAEVTRLGTPFDADFDALVFNPGYWRDISGDGGSRYGPLLGLRYFDLDLTLETTILPDFDGGQDWLDGLVGWRYHGDLGGRWGLLLQGDIGAGDSDLTAQGMLLFSREFDSGDRLSFGYRALTVDYTEDENRGLLRPFGLDVTFHGLIVGYVFD